MTPIPHDAPASIACSRSGLPLLAECANGHRRTVPFRLLKTHDGDTTPLYSRPFKCRACGNRQVSLFLIDKAELDAIQAAEPARPTLAPTTHARHDPDEDLP